MYCPLTHAAAATVAGHSGENFQGYPDYRGVNVVGAWQWLDDLRIGVIAEMDHDEAFKSLVPLRKAYGWLIAMLGLSLLGCTAFAAALVLERRATQTKRIAPTKLITNWRRWIGPGISGQSCVAATHNGFKAVEARSHQRENQRRFEREVHLASSLTHPNTIEIFDYGVTTDGGFYAAMEFIDGMNLSQVVSLSGPQCPARVIRILTEVHDP